MCNRVGAVRNIIQVAYGLFVPYAGLVMAQSSRGSTGTGTGQRSSSQGLVLERGYVYKYTRRRRNALYSWTTICHVCLRRCKCARK